MAQARKIRYTVFECPKCGRRDLALGKALSCLGNRLERNDTLVGGHDGAWMKRIGIVDQFDADLTKIVG